MAVGILGIVASAFARLHSSNFNALAHTELKQDLISLRSKIEDRISCRQTIDSLKASYPTLADCNTNASFPTALNQLVELRDNQGNIFLNNTTNNKFGKWKIVAMCNKIDSVKGIQVFAARPKPGKSIFSSNAEDFYRSSLNQKIYNLQNNKIFKDAFRVCGSDLNSPTSPSNPSNAEWQILGMISPKTIFNQPTTSYSISGDEYTAWTTTHTFKAKGTKQVVTSTADLAARGDNASHEVYYLVKKTSDNSNIFWGEVHKFRGVVDGETDRLRASSTFSFPTEPGVEYSIKARKKCVKDSDETATACLTEDEIDFVGWDIK